jgi:hypothetical protein
MLSTPLYSLQSEALNFSRENRRSCRMEEADACEKVLKQSVEGGGGQFVK